MKNNNTTKIQQAIIGLDLGDKKHQICVTDNKNGNILEEFSMPNTRKHLEKLIDKYPGALVAIEVGTHSAWISRLLTAKGASVITANARKLRAIYTNDRKSDLVDARMLAKLARVDPSLLHPIRHGSEQCQKDMLAIKLRDTLVRQRVNIISSIRGMLKSLGVRIPSPSTPCFTKTARVKLQEHADLLGSIEPGLRTLDELSASIRELDKKIKDMAQNKYPETQRLEQIVGVGSITSLCFALVIGDSQRFHDPRDVGAFLGLVPRRDQSGDTDKRLPISKAGNGYMRRLLVQSAQYIMGPFGGDSDLRRYGLRLTERGGSAAKKKAVVAVARKLAVLMLVLWQRGSEYEPLKNKTGEVPEAA